MPATTVKQKRTITPEVVQEAIALREANQPWSAVIEATGFNGAALRPHMARAGFATAQVIVPVELKPESIANARKAGMSWYALAIALGVSEVKLRQLASEHDPSAASGRVYLKAAPVKPEPEVKPTKKPARKRAATAKK